MTGQLWFSVPLCGFCWSLVEPRREPVRIREGTVEGVTCIRCDEPLASPTYVRACWPGGAWHITSREDDLHNECDVQPCRECLVKRIEAALAFCDQQAKDRSLYSDDREKYELAYIDGWNDALDRVEQFLRGESDE